MKSFVVGISLIIMSATAASAQTGGFAVSVSVGAFQHNSDLTPSYFGEHLRFDDAPAFGVGVSSPNFGILRARVIGEIVNTKLSGATVEDGDRNHAHLLTAEAQLLADVLPHGAVDPFVGVGLGARRYTVETYIVSGDVIYPPWDRPQTQPIVSGLGGVRVAAGPLRISAELSLSNARFRFRDYQNAGQTVKWQRETRETLRVELPLD